MPVRGGEAPYFVGRVAVRDERDRFAPSRRARASACMTSKPVGLISTTGTATRVFRYAPFEPPAITTSGRAAPARVDFAYGVFETV